MTDVCLIIPSLNIARSVVLPISINATPALSLDLIRPKRYRLKCDTFKIDSSTFYTSSIFLIDDTCPTTTWKFASSLAPNIPIAL